MRKKLVAFCFILSFISVIAVLISIYTVYDKDISPSVTAITMNTHALKKHNISTKDFKSSVTLSAVGDILIHGTIYKAAKTPSGYDFQPMFSHIKPYLESADITFANQETIIGGKELGLSTYPRFNSPFAIADALKESGIDIISIANNHTLDRGEQAVYNATNYLDKVGLLYTGGYRSNEDRLNIRTIKRNGITFSFIAYTYGTNGIPLPRDKAYLVNVIDYDRIAEDIKKAKKLSDIIVVSLHYGNEYERIPNEYQRDLSKHLVNLGAHIILGHHPHVLQPMEWIHTEDGHKGFVAYSLGNFLSGQKSIYREIGGILTLTINKEIKNGITSIEINDPIFMPTYVSKKGYVIVPLEKANQFGLYDSSKWLTDIEIHMNQFLSNSTLARAN